MCKSMTDFETLVQTIQAQKEERDNLNKQIKEKEDELKAYMKKRQTLSTRVCTRLLVG